MNLSENNKSKQTKPMVALRKSVEVIYYFFVLNIHGEKLKVHNLESIAQEEQATQILSSIT